MTGTRRAAHEDHDSVVKLTRELVRIPSRGGVDPYEQVLDYMSAWLAGHGRPAGGSPDRAERPSR